MSRPLFFYSDAFQHYDMGPQHPMQPRRLRMTYDLLSACGVLATGVEVAEPAPARRQDLAGIHSHDYLEAIEHAESGTHFPGMHRFGLDTPDNPVFPEIYSSSMLYTGASIDAAQAILDGAGGGQVAFNISGGLHHAHFARAAGFCVLNDCAAAIKRLRTRFARVAYIDIDVHHGDGVQEIFYRDPAVLTVSLHESGRTLFPGTGFVREIGEGEGEGFSVNLPFAPETTGEIWLAAWRDAVLPIVRAFDPEAIVLQMGADAHATDPLAHLKLSVQEWLEAVRDVHLLGRPIVAIGGGGYNFDNVCRMWTLAVAELAEIDLPDALPAEFARRLGMDTLRDPFPPVVDPLGRERAREAAEHAGEELKALLFPRFGLRG